MHSKKVQRSLDVFEHTQVMLQTIPRTRDPGMPKTCRDLCPLEQDEKLGPDPAAGSYQDSHAPGTCITMGKEAYGVKKLQGVFIPLELPGLQATVEAEMVLKNPLQSLPASQRVLSPNVP